MFDCGISKGGAVFWADQLYSISCISCFRAFNCWKIILTMGLGSGVDMDVGPVCLCIFRCGLFPVVPRSNVSSSAVADTCDRIGGCGTGSLLGGSQSVLCVDLAMVFLYHSSHVVASAYQVLFLVLSLTEDFTNVALAK